MIKSSNYEFLSEEIISGLTRDDAISLIDKIIIVLENKLQKNISPAVAIIKKAFEIKKLIRNNNLNPQIAMDNLLVFAKKKLSS